MIDVSRQTRLFLRDATVLHHLPPDLLSKLRQESAAFAAADKSLLDGIAQAALCLPLTEHVFVHFEKLFPDICARWAVSAEDSVAGTRIRLISSLARVLPFAPYLDAFLRCPGAAVYDSPKGHSSAQLLLPQFDEGWLSKLDHSSLLEGLVALWRLLNFDFRSYSPIVSISYMQALFQHESRSVRYIAIRIFGLLLHASDHKLEALVQEYVGTEVAVNGHVDGVAVDFGFLSLHEQNRAQNLIALRSQLQAESQKYNEEVGQQKHITNLTSHVIPFGDVLLPRPRGPVTDASTLVMTSTTTKNLERLAALLREEGPVLLHGPAGSGKTSFVREIAMQLGKYSDMVTLHLNEQTDAKMLIGLYSTDSKPGSFQWRPGVLTTAVREGRWVLVEDLDRAPTEVLSTFLPLIERNELLIPSRGEKVKAASGFRLFATVQTQMSRGIKGRESLPSLVGMRFWRTFCPDALTPSELEEVVLTMYPVLRKFVPGIMAVHARLAQLGGSNVSSISRGRSAMDRQINVRDLLKWCRRLRACLLADGGTTGDEPISENTQSRMFMEALDCFVGSCPNGEVAKHLTCAIAEEMHMSKDQATHYLAANIPSLDENDRFVCIGRAQLRRKKMLSRVQRSRRPFASTAHAKRLLEQIAVAVKLEEPVLLVGETGVGKTTVVQQLAESLGHKLIAVNLSQQSEVGDLLGGFKPVHVRSLAVPLKEEFEDLFAATRISASKNQTYLEQIDKFFARSQWSKVGRLWKEGPKKFAKMVSEMEQIRAGQVGTQQDEVQPAKRRKTQSTHERLLALEPRWKAFANRLQQFDVQISSGGSGAFAFSFIEGKIVKAVRNGDWILLDEINLASPDTLESIADLLADPGERPFILLSETGEIEKIVAHPDFRIFGAMNPATDVGKRDLPMGIRSRFTELYVKSPDTDLKDLLTIIKAYLGNASTKTDHAAEDVARLYLDAKRMAEEKRLVDGANEVPHFSLRTLTRVLSYVQTIAPLYGLRRALYEGFAMGFLTLLDRESEELLLPLMHRHLLDKHGNPQSFMSQPPKHPNDGRKYVKFSNRSHDRLYWLLQGHETPMERQDYILTPYVERNLLNLVRATSTRRFPVLIQGPTSAGKTSMIEYLASFTGNKFVRINNHEHTDLQEYLGTYVSGPDGKLRFQEGLLVQAMRQGHWIVLDELNLAPTDVLEALNRLLDDNRELLIPETQELVRPHENFILFATQNPPGLYGGRKILSRAFRNRFLELHFDDIPEDELEYILQKRCRNTSPPDCRRIVTVYKELSRLRQTSRLFEQKDSFATLRDLFRWALREADTREEIAAHGFMLLAERVRVEEERVAVKEVIEKVFKVRISPLELYTAPGAPELKRLARENAQGVVWTCAMRRLYVLVSRALRNNEPVLLVGETGCGKTTVVQLLAEALGQELHIVNAHQNTETGDLIGSQRPVRNRGAIMEALDADLTAAFESIGQEAPANVEVKLEMYQALDAPILATVPQAIRDRIFANEARSKALFEWSDGALVEAMRGGHFFLLDEISLADDSVLERLNSVLEPQRTLLLAEKGVDNSFVAAANGFQFLATMNPGGDFGKRELSPALRNRFTEIWVPPLSESEDILEIARAKLEAESRHLAGSMVDFAHWFAQTSRPMARSSFSVREMLVWVQFVNEFQAKNTVLNPGFVHGAAAIFIDSIGANPSAVLAAASDDAVNRQRRQCLKKLGELTGQDFLQTYTKDPALVVCHDTLSIGDFTIRRDPTGVTHPSFSFDAPTTRSNAMRVVRALQMQKPILLEGSPGVGKTALIVALSQACGRPLTRINLSDQTDLMDLFGTDVPVEGKDAGNFAWRDAPFLQAMQNGEWVLLDEMNLASQSVLEGLNACLDHRGEVYIAELDQVFKRHPEFRLFAAQNPHHQGGGRKGLPASFVNRFIVVYADVFQAEDLKLIASHEFPDTSPNVVAHLIDFVSEVEREIVARKTFGSQGGPWEFNLRDVLRWLHLMSSSDALLRNASIDDFFDMMARQRFRTARDRREVGELFARVIGREPRDHNLYHILNSRFCQVGLALLERNLIVQPERLPNINIVPRLAELESIMVCVRENIPCILTSPSGYGKSSLLTYTAAICGRPLVVFPMNADIDTMDLVGGFEQADPLREINAALVDLRTHLQGSVMSVIPSAAPVEALHLLHLLDRHGGDQDGFLAILSAIDALLRLVAPDSQAGSMLLRVKELLQGPLRLENPRFEWLDGVIVRALTTGQWLVLDNANLCSASVLDRLNSLLEPQGFLSINEHCDSDGRPRIVKPHHDFRIFLTTDPKYGELSRAMRNRAVEIHLTCPPPETAPCFERLSVVEGGLQRFHYSNLLTDGGARDSTSTNVAGVAVEHLSLEDMALLPRFIAQVSRHSADGDGRGRGLISASEDLLAFLQSVGGSRILRTAMQLYATLPPGATAAMPNSQPIHMLHNQSVSKLLSRGEIAAWMGHVFDKSQRLHHIRKAVQQHQVQAEAQSSKLASLNRLQRSLISQRVAAVSRDSTVQLGEFLASLMTEIEGYLGRDVGSLQPLLPRLQLLTFLVLFLERTVSLSSRMDFDEAYFQVHLNLGTTKMQAFVQATTVDIDSALVCSIIDRMSRDFKQGFQLSTGLSMEMLWNTFRPVPIATQAVLDRSREIEQLSTRLDAIRWRTFCRISDLFKAQGALVQAHKIVKDDSMPSEQLVKDLTTAIEDLELHVGPDSPDTTPFFATEFNHLRQMYMLAFQQNWLQGPEPDGQLIILSDISTKETMLLANCPPKAISLQTVTSMAYQNSFIWDGKLITSLWRKLDSIGDVSLSSLGLLETELPILGRHLTCLTSHLAADPIPPLNDLLMRIMSDTLEAHSPQARDALLGCYAKLNSHVVSLSQPKQDGLPVSPNAAAFNDVVQVIQAPHLRQIVSEYFIPAVVGIVAAKSNAKQSARFSALAWLRFSIGLVQLYVPDKMFDPQLPSKAELDFFGHLEASLRDELTSLTCFQARFTAQSTSARIELVESQLSNLGTPPKDVRSLFRPERSELAQIQAEFFNILKVTTAPFLQAVVNGAGQEFSDADRAGLRLTRDNVSLLVGRLSSRFEAYQDMTQPAVGILRCLLVGLSLCECTRARELEHETSQIVNMTPFVGSTISNGPLEELDSNTFEFLGLMNMNVAVCGFQSLMPTDREAVLKCFHAFFNDWTQKLDADRKSEAAKTSLYRFRGAMEDEEEIDATEFNALFPTFDGDEGAAGHDADKPDQVRLTSLKVANAHRKIFADRQEPLTAFRESCLAMGRRIATELRNQDSVDRGMNSRMLPATVLLLAEKMDELQDNVSNKAYNFYADANLAEARQLVSLTQQVKARFRELQLVDEIGHMQPLADVVQSCDRLLGQVHGEPLAKLLPRVEQLHAHVYEWQFGGWASKAYDVVSHHNSLTNTIIRWRRLELSTWANLFDMEQTKCRDDAYSWWFVAYQVVIAVPLTLVDSDSHAALRDYAKQLVEDLGLYFSTSIVGQFKTRVALLRQLLSHLDALAQDYPNLNMICAAVTNFLRYYRRYEKAADEAIQKGRAPIDKKMKDVLLLASWKDTNINALRESARKSHQKLFRLVRKFRGVLGQEMKLVTEQGLPDEDVSASSSVNTEATPVATPAINVEMINQTLPGWLESHKRLANLSKTVSIMRKITYSPETSSNVPDLILDFVTELNASMAELRKETPSILCDENKDIIKHLKTRKRKLFADTLRDLRAMGIQYNLSQDKLAQQNSLAVVLSNLATARCAAAGAASDAEYFLHKTLDLAPKAREVAREHSQDLTGAEAARSLGFVEGLIHLNLAQRRSLGVFAGACESLQETILQFTQLGVSSQENERLVRKSRGYDWPRLLSWLHQGTRFSIHLISIQEKLAKTDNRSVLERLEHWVTRIATRSSASHDLIRLPPRISSAAHEKLDHDVLADLDEFSREICSMMEARADLAFVLRHLKDLARIDFTTSDLPLQDVVSLGDFADAVAEMSDKVLVAVEGARRKGIEVPRDLSEPGWLVKHNDAFFIMMRQLHLSDIQTTVGRCVEMMQGLQLDDEHISRAATCIVGLASPILNQFLQLCLRLVNQAQESHCATAHMAYSLTKAFVQIASQGFCTPQEKSEETSGDAGQLEAGTGLGDGEGADDISKDIQPDEDLTELAQEANQEQNGDIEDKKDAVDMADEDLEGELGSVAGDDEEEEGSKKGDDDENDEENAMDEEAGDVDDLDPTAVDEKMWDGGDDEEKAEKEQQGNETKGHRRDDEQMVAEENTKRKNDEPEPEPEPQDEEESEQPKNQEQEEPDEEDVHAPEELNRQDQNVPENDALDLPDEMDLDFDEKQVETDSDDLDGLSDTEDAADEQQTADTDDDMDDGAARQMEEETGNDEEMSHDEIDEQEMEMEMPNATDEVQEEAEEEEEEEAASHAGDEDRDGEMKPEEAQGAEEKSQPPPPQDNANADVDNAAPSHVKSSGMDQEQDQQTIHAEDKFQAQAAQQEQGDLGDGAVDQDTSAGSKGATSRSDEMVDRSQQEQEHDVEEPTKSDPFRKLGDALEKWHRLNTDIMDAKQEDGGSDEKTQDRSDANADQGRMEFQHLQNDDSAADAQAMGAANEDEVQPIDESMAVDTEGDEKDPTSHRMEPDADDDQDAQDMDVGESTETNERDGPGGQSDEKRVGVQTRQGNTNLGEETPSEADAVMAEEASELEEETEEESGQKESTRDMPDKESRRVRDYGECAKQWSELQAKTHALSLSLTSQLRLILTPSQSTKLSGSFRTGKRLNIKRIIPYIASGYKRDKIWMRRATPTKRTYQILLCVDDSKSMGEGASGRLAMESLVMVSRSLSMLEAGQVGVVGFGSDVLTAHELTEPMASDAGAKALQTFTFSQARTDVVLLIRQIVDQFRAARQQRQQSGGKPDLWQLALILSDGLTQSSAHDAIRRLLREAMEERIMIVFIIMDHDDDARGTTKGSTRGDSVLDLKQAKFVKGPDGQSTVVIERYLDTFPFQYYLIVHNLDELPTALAGLLRTWFAEVAS